MTYGCGLLCTVHERTVYHLMHNNCNALMADLESIRGMSAPDCLWDRNCKCQLATRVEMFLKAHGYSK